MQTTRGRILKIIQSRQSESVGGLARKLNLAPATVRRHLDILQRDGLVMFTEVRKGTGRPEHSFSLTARGHEAMPKSYDKLLNQFFRELGRLSVDDISGRSGRDVLELTLRRLGARAAAAITVNGGRPVDVLREVLAQRGFGPKIRERADGVRITLTNCPFRAVAINNPEVCAYDRGMISGILNSPVREEECIGSSNQCCVLFAPGIHGDAALVT